MIDEPFRGGEMDGRMHWMPKTELKNRVMDQHKVAEFARVPPRALR